MSNVEVVNFKRTLAISRSILYDFLSSLYLYPRNLNDFNNFVKSKINVVKSASMSLTNIYDFKDLNEVMRYAEKVNDYDSLTQIEADLTRVDYGVPPYEGYVHRGYFDVGVESMVNAIYAEFGMSVNKGFRDLRGDHIVIELSFMSYLAYKSYEDFEHYEKYTDAEINFLINHLAVWIPIFVIRALNLKLKTSYVKGILRFTRYFIQRDKEVITSLGDLS
ncbi:molecular chaperone [Caldivirga sp.]|uniref:TorD/DmsD family molecular chaperone n=1 Tax=Caldivirga sp. TaxID=2080243 RepID=UPI0025C6FEAD|nr:molecular chaperone TorD family protein [Caldivirga sp.]